MAFVTFQSFLGKVYSRKVGHFVVAFVSFQSFSGKVYNK